MRLRSLIPAATAALLASLSTAAGAVDVGVSINFAQPGVYGRVDIGRFPAPALIAPRAVIAPVPVVVGVPRPVYVAPPEPLYLWVPPGHRAHWSRYCGQYHACGRPVYFVRDDWYRERVMARRGPPGREVVVVEHGHGHGRGHDRDEDHDRRDDHDHGRGRGRGHGHGNPHDD